MIQESDFLFARKALIDSGVDRMLGLQGPYLEAFVDKICWTYRQTDSVVWVNSRFQRVSGFIVKSAIVLGGGLLSTIKSKLCYNKYCFRRATSRIIAIPFCSAHVRFKYVYDFVGDDITLVYSPIFHFQHLQKHIDCFERQGKTLMIGTFRLRDIMSVAFSVVKNGRALKKCHREFDKHFSRDYGYLVSSVIVSMLYRFFIRRLMAKIPNDGISRKWLFDYDFDFKYIIFNNEIKKARPEDVTFHIQHGAFFDYCDQFCNPLSDVSICCSLREKAIIEKANKFHSHIYAQGSSWQSIEKTQDFVQSSQTCFDVLALLTDTVDEYTTELQKKLLCSLSGAGVRVLVRYRPQTRDLDRGVLGGFTEGMTVSDGTTLKEDITSSRVIACFSEDAVFECFRNNRKVLFLTKHPQCYNYEIAVSDNIKIVSAENFSIDIIKRFLENPDCDYTRDYFVRYNFGDFEFERVKNNLNSILERY